MSQDDDFPPTQAAPPPPPEPAAPPHREAPRTHDAVYASVKKTLPARGWKENPLIWIALVVAMFMAVPMLASMANRGKAPARPQAGSAPTQAAEAEPPAPVIVPVPAAVNNTAVAPTAAPGNVNQLPPNLRPQTDPSRQMITKCYENGRVVYTQTGACTGSMTAVPVDTGKNVVGPGSAAPAGATR